MTAISLRLRAAAVRWRMDGPPGALLDAFVAQLIGAGVNVEVIEPGRAYRLAGPYEMLDVLREELAAAGADVYLGIEVGPEDGSVLISSSLAPAFAYRRAVVVHGGGASFVARAVDHGLEVQTVGVERWRITGRSAALLAWLVAAWGKPANEVRAVMGWTPEVLDAEDTAPAVNVELPPVEVRVDLPPRRIVSQIERDPSGQITNVTQLETTDTAGDQA